MIWSAILIVSLLVVLLAAASIWGTLDDERDLATGHPTWETIVSYTGHWHPAWIEDQLGVPDDEGRFTVSQELLQQLPIAHWKRVFDSTTSDIICGLAAVAAPIVWYVNPLTSIVLCIASFLFISIGYAWAGIVLYRASCRTEAGKAKPTSSPGPDESA